MEPQIQNLIHSKDRKFDLLILEAYFGDCYVPFGRKFNIPTIKLSTFGGTNWMADWIGNPNELAYVPDSYLPLSDKMTYLERMLNVVIGVFIRLSRRYYLLPRMETILKEKFNDTSISMLKMEYSTSMLMLNTHFSIGYPRPLLPNVVLVGGMHVKPPKKLPQVSSVFVYFCLF